MYNLLSSFIQARFERDRRQLGLLDWRVSDLDELHEEEHIIVLIELLQLEAESFYVAGEGLNFVKATLYFSYKEVTPVEKV